ncbi:hypothetical protein H9P43_003482 [Blastocladiella emersonii ATCC 22665]|nr:hypothetical protein H9P43_003482 [Blastocladiella emersonii ATCC 22665]
MLLCLATALLAVLLVTAVAAADVGAPATSSVASLLAQCRTCHRRSEVQIGVVSHGDWNREAFWRRSKTGITRANELYNISAYPLNPLIFDPVENAVAVANAAANFSLIGTTIVDMATVGNAVLNITRNKQATVIAYNAGDGLPSSVGVMNFVGQPEYTAAFKVGVTLGREGKVKIACINHEAGNAGLVARCNGVSDGLKSITASASSTTVTVDGTSIAAIDAGIGNAVDTINGLDSIVTQGTDVVMRAIQVVQNKGRTSSIAIATFDISADVCTAILQGKILFAIDQQEVLQTFTTVQMLKVYQMTGGMSLATQLLLSGPSVIKLSNAQRKLCQLDPTQSGCTSPSASSITIAIAATGSWQGTDSFYQQAKFGALAAAREHGTTVRFVDTNLFDLQALSSLVQTTINDRVSALVLPVPSTGTGQNFAALVDAAAAQNIPVVTWATGMVRGFDRVALGKSLVHIGQNETASGALVGARLNALIPANAQVLCITQELGNDDMTLKCAGIQAALTGGRTVVAAGLGGNSLPLAVSVRNTVQSVVDIQSALAAFPRVAAIVYPSAEAAKMVLTATAGSTNMVVAGYGVSTDIADSILGGRIAFTLDEQPFLQAYMAVASLSFFLTDGYILQNPLLETGPRIIDASTLASAVCRADTMRDPSTECPPCPAKCGAAGVTGGGICLDSGACQCKSGWLLGPDRDCTVKDPGLTFISAQSGVAIALMFVTGLTMAVTLAITAFIIYFRADPTIKATSWSISVGMQAGIFAVLASVFPAVGAPSASACAARPFLLSLGFATTIGFLVAKTWRIYLLFNTIKLRGRKISDLQVVAWGCGFVMVNAVICIAWVATDPPVPTNIFIAEGLTNVVCKSRGGAESAFEALLIGYNVILILVGTALGFVTRTVIARFNESKSIGMVMYNLIALAAIGVPLAVSSTSNLTLWFVVQTVVTLLGCISTQAILFGPKIMSILKSKEIIGKDASDTSFALKTASPTAMGGSQASPAWSAKANVRKRTTSRGISDPSLQDSSAVGKSTIETLYLHASARVIKGRVDSLTAPWFPAFIVYLGDPAVPMLNIFDVSIPGRIGATIELTQSLFGVVEMEMSATGSQASTASSAGHNPSASQIAHGGAPGSAESSETVGSLSQQVAGIISLRTANAQAIYIQFSNPAQFALWNGQLAKACGFSTRRSTNSKTGEPENSSQVKVVGRPRQISGNETTGSGPTI